MISHVLAPALVVAAAAPASEQAAERELVPVVLRIDVSALESAQEGRWVAHMQKIAERYIPPMLEKRGVALVDGARGEVATVTVAMSWIDYKASIYATDITISRPGHPEHKLEQITCDPCMDHMVVERLEPHFDDVLPWLAVDLPTKSVPDPTPDTSAPPAEDAATRPRAASPVESRSSIGDESEPSPRRPLGALGWAGIATMGIGAAALVSGGVVYSRGEQTVSAAPWSDQVRDYRPPGVATMVVGGVLLGTGVAILSVRLVGPARPRTTARLGFDRTFAGATVTHRF